MDETSWGRRVAGLGAQGTADDAAALSGLRSMDAQHRRGSSDLQRLHTHPDSARGACGAAGVTEDLLRVALAQAWRRRALCDARYHGLVRALVADQSVLWYAHDAALQREFEAGFDLGSALVDRSVSSKRSVSSDDQRDQRDQTTNETRQTSL